jgi:hypothetical protein
VGEVVELDDSAPVAEARRAVCEALVGAAATWRAEGRSRPNSRLALAAGVSACAALAADAEVGAGVA